MPVISVSEFLRALVEVLPGTVHAHASVLLPHLSSRPYQIRQAVVVGLAEVVAAAHEDKTAAAAKDGEADGGAAATADGDGGEDESQVQDALWSNVRWWWWWWCGSRFGSLSGWVPFVCLCPFLLCGQCVGRDSVGGASCGLDSGSEGVCLCVLLSSQMAVAAVVCVPIGL